MKRISELLTKTVATFAAITVLIVSLATASFAQTKVTAEDARKIAKEAYIFNYTLVLYYRSMYQQALDSKTGAGMGKWLHLGTSSPKDTTIVSPNNDTPYSYAWVDVRAEPWVLTMPKIDDSLFYTSQWNDLWGFVLDNPGSVEDGNGGVNVILASTDWQGDTPDGIARVVRGETDFLGTLTRTQIIGDDIAPVRAIQADYKLQPLSEFLGKEAPAAAPKIDWMEWTEGDETTDKFWSYTNFLLSFVHKNDMDKPMYDDMAKIGLEAGKQWSASMFDKDIADAIAAGMKDAIDHLDGETTTFTDPSLFFRSRADAGTDYDNRALGTLVGIFGNVNAVSVYIAIPKDNNGVLFDGSKDSYEMTFTKDQLPPNKYFWSMTMYKLPQRWLVDNPINRYSIGSATPGVVYNDDGSLTLYISKDSPGKDLETNWLPAPDGPFWPVMRNYGPTKAIVDKTYQVPPIVVQ